MTTKTGAEALNLLDDPQARVWWRRPAFWLIVVLMTVLLAAWFFWSKNQANQAAPVFVTTPLARGNLTLSVMANGTCNRHARSA
jgi:HlyD family secretion protein